MPTIELRARSGRVTLAGTLHLPDAPATTRPPATVLMVPGSGPSDRDNDVYFPPIRDRLLAAGLAVASFDKRGVGGSTGDWHDTGPAEQTADALSAIALLRARPELDPARIGLFGHSQGGWVVLETAATDPQVAFVVTNAGPGVTPSRQERYAVETRMRLAGEPDERIRAALERLERMAALIRAGAPHEAFTDLAKDPDLDRHTLVPVEVKPTLRLMQAWLDHDPRPALERMRVPLLAIFGSADPLVPVAASLAVFREALAGRPGALSELIVEGGDHRCRVGDPPVLPDAYHRGLADWIVAHI